MTLPHLPAGLIVEERIGCEVQAASKKRILETVGRLLASGAPGLTQEGVFDRLLERERLGSTALGHGVALPHARMAGVERALGAFIKLEAGVDFDAIDDAPVDLVFGLLVPEEATQEHLDLLGFLARLFSDAELCARLRRSCAPALVLSTMAGPETGAA